MKPTNTTPPREQRPVAAVGEVGHEEGDRIGEGAPGEDVGQRQAADHALHRELDKDVGGDDDERHGGHERADEVLSSAFFYPG